MMIEIPQNDENENEEQKFLNLIKNEEEIDINPQKKNIIKSISLIIILIILICSFYIKNNNSLNTIEKITEINNTNKIKTNLSIIINSFNKNNDLISLINQIFSNRIDNSELIISTNYEFNYNLSNEHEKEIKNKNISTKLIEYNENTNRVKMRLDSALKSTGDYLIFFDPEQNPSLNILNSYQNTVKDNIDIIQYDFDLDHIENNKIIYQPQIFESLFFNHDSFSYNHFHILGKLYKREIFTNAAKNLNKLYLEQSNKYFDEMIIVSLVFKEANTFIKLKQSSSCDRNKCQANLFKRYDYNKEVLKDVVLFVRFLLEYTGKDKVQEKRMAAKMFKDLLIDKNVRTFYNNEINKLIHETIDLYLDCELINDIDKNEIIKYRKSIRK